MTEYDFATLLGISNFKYQNIRFLGGKTYIQDPKVVEAVNLIGDIEKQKFYSKDEIEKICKQYQISVEDFIRYFVYKGNLSADIHLYLNALNSHSGLYIGKARMSNEYFEKIQSALKKTLERCTRFLCSKYRLLKYFEDYQSEAILYILENCGDIEKNFYDFEDPTIISYMLTSRAKFFLIPQLSNKIKLYDNQKSTSTFYPRRNNPTLVLPDKQTNVEEAALSRIPDESTEAKIMR